MQKRELGREYAFEVSCVECSRVDHFEDFCFTEFVESSSAGKSPASAVCVFAVEWIWVVSKCVEKEKDSKERTSMRGGQITQVID